MAGDAIEKAIIAEANAKMSRAAHTIVEEVLHDFDARLGEMADTIRKEAHEQLKSEHQRNTIEKDDAESGLHQAARTCLLAISNTVLASQQLENLQFMGAPNDEPFVRTGGSPELGSSTPIRRSAAEEMPERATPSSHSEDSPEPPDPDSGEDMPLARLRRGVKRKIVDDDSYSEGEQRSANPPGTSSTGDIDEEIPATMPRPLSSPVL
ncbi:hypothetical protein Hte_009446 [Hypoxylon texense]